VSLARVLAPVLVSWRVGQRRPLRNQQRNR